MIKKLVSELYIWPLMGAATVFGKRLLRYGFNINVLTGDFFDELTVGVLVFTVLAALSFYRKRRK